jgi:N-acetylglucosaminyldiphosphoundecaprenol N-acetyl-beta-D-mannosaminyltransferase
MPRNYTDKSLKDYILGIKVSVTDKVEVLDFVNSKLDSKEKFYIVTPNPENLLLATKHWLLAKAIRRSDLAIPDGIGLAQAYKFLNFRDNRKNIFRPFLIFAQGLWVGLSTIVNKSYLTTDFQIIKGRELFYDIIKIANDKHLKVYLFGGENGEQLRSKEVLERQYPNIEFKTHFKFPQYNRNGQPATKEDRKLHKGIIGSIKLFEPHLVVVALNTPKQEKWIYRNFFRLTNVTGALALGGTFNYVAGNMKLPPKWMEKIGLEWVYRFIQEPKRWKRIFNAIIVFPWTTFVYKLTLPDYSKRPKKNIKKTV